jgi:Putative zinc-finger
MSEDRLDRALQEMKEEDVDSARLEAARTRVWAKVTNADSATCAEFRQDFRAYLANELGGSRRILVEDHLSRCPGCRARIAEMKGERPIIAMPRRSSSRWVQWGAMAAAAAALFAVLYLGRNAIDAMMGPGGSRATVVSADGGVYSLAALSADLSAEARSAKVEGHEKRSTRRIPYCTGSMIRHSHPLSSRAYRMSIP